MWFIARFLLIILADYDGKLNSDSVLKVASIEGPERNPQKVDAWIESMRDLHRSKPLSSVIYSKPMPDIEQLMEVEEKYS